MMRHIFDDARLTRMQQAALELLSDIEAGDRSKLDKILQGRKIFVIVGPGASGGAYISRCLATVLTPKIALDRIMRSESLPRSSDLRMPDNPAYRKQCLFELVQWALWFDEHYSESRFIVKKCSGFVHAMDIAAQFFGPADVTYIVTVRHPADILRSGKDAARRHPRGLTHWPGALESKNSYFARMDTPQEWAGMNEEERSLFVWCDIYRSIVRRLPDAQRSRVRAVGFGNGPAIVGEIARELGPEFERRSVEAMGANKFIRQASDRGSFWESERAVSSIAEVGAEWRIAGIDWPL